MAAKLESPPAPPTDRPSLAALFRAFAKISLVSFGGGISALVYREIVVSRRWLPESEFMPGLALSQAMPGVNVTNLAIWIGYHLRGPVGAVVACLGVLVPAGLLVIGLGTVLTRIGQTYPGALMLAGIGAAALGLSLNMGIRTARFALRDPVCVAVFAIALLGAWFAGSIVLLMAVLAPVSVFLAYRRLPDE